MADGHRLLFISVFLAHICSGAPDQALRFPPLTPHDSFWHWILIFFIFKLIYAKKMTLVMKWINVMDSVLKLPFNPNLFQSSTQTRYCHCLSLRFKCQSLSFKKTIYSLTKYFSQRHLLYSIYSKSQFSFNFYQLSQSSRYWLIDWWKRTNEMINNETPEL